MCRSKKKGIFVQSYFLSNAFRFEEEEKRIFCMGRDSTIVSTMRRRWIFVHTGRGFRAVYIKKSMIGRKLGEFAPTTKFGKRIHNTKKNLKKKQRKKK
jgi:small subunit ribosomal protein S19